VTLRIAAVGDIHVGEDSRGRLAPCYAELQSCADLLLLAGDLTRTGTPAEAAMVAEELAAVPVPVVAVLGNHDVHSDAADKVTSCLREAGIAVLDGDAVVVDVDGTSVGVAGTCGFGGGFVGRSASAFGEPEMKAFVNRSCRMADELEQALAGLTCDVRVALTHYSPVPETLVGEPTEIYPFLGSYLLAEAIDHVGADLALHGHAHRGSERGLTPGGVRVRNVAQPVIGAPFRVFELG
jgi:Icc-related predicted phosphoesterase